MNYGIDKSFFAEMVNKKMEEQKIIDKNPVSQYVGMSSANWHMINTKGFSDSMKPAEIQGVLNYINDTKKRNPKDSLAAKAENMLRNFIFNTENTDLLEVYLENLLPSEKLDILNKTKKESTMELLFKDLDKDSYPFIQNEAVFNFIIKKNFHKTDFLKNVPDDILAKYLKDNQKGLAAISSEDELTSLAEFGPKTKIAHLEHISRTDYSKAFFLQRDLLNETFDTELAKEIAKNINYSRANDFPEVLDEILEQLIAQGAEKELRNNYSFKPYFDTDLSKKSKIKM